MSDLRTISKELGRAAGRALPSVVAVLSGRCGELSGVVWSGGRVVTAASRLQREEGLEVLLGGERHDATLLGYDLPSDVAVLHVEGNAPVPPERATGPVAIGELVFALARDPLPLARFGCVARVGREWRAPGGARFERYIESDITPTLGLAGSALIDATGNLLGINSVSIARGRLVTLPVQSVDRIVEAITTHGYVRRARLGVSVQRVELPPALARDLGRRNGLIVLGVQPGSSADTSGLTLGDVLLKLGSVKLERVEELQGALEVDAIDASLAVEFLRAGKLIETTVVPRAAVFGPPTPKASGGK